MKILCVIFTLLMLSACSKFGPEQEKAWQLIDQGALLIDVRTVDEFKSGHLKNAINIEYQDIPRLVKSIGKDKKRSVVLYCRSGRRASVAMAELSKQGYHNILNGQGLTQMQNALEHKKSQNTKK